MNSAVIEIQGLTKFYGRNRGVADLAFSVEAGEVFGYLGPNGAGKTTTIRLLLDLIRPTRGTARLFGLDARRDGTAARRRIGYLPGELALDPRMTGRNALGLLGRLRGPVDWPEVQRLAERLGCDLSRRVGALSHGNRQKLGLIQAFMHRPELLVLDEPTLGLDPLVQHEFYLMVEEARAAGRTVFISSHVLPEVERLCDRVAIIRAGRLAAVERVDDLKQRALRRIEVRFAAPVSATEFSGLPGVADVVVEGDRLRCTATGRIDGLVKTLARHEVRDFISHEPTLEETFIAYYGANSEP